MAFPVFVVTQIVLVITDADLDLPALIKEMREEDRYLFVPFIYSVVVYLVTLLLRNRVQLYDAAVDYRSETEGS